MSEVVPDFEGRQGRPPTYPWDKWMDGEIHKLYQDEDFPNALVTSFRVRAHQVAKGYGLKVKTQIVDDGDAILIEFYSPDED
jgi:hypothetical protein